MTLLLPLQTDILCAASFFVMTMIVGFRPPYNQLVRLSSCSPIASLRRLLEHL